MIGWDEGAPVGVFMKRFICQIPLTLVGGGKGKFMSVTSHTPSLQNEGYEVKAGSHSHILKEC